MTSNLPPGCNSPDGGIDHDFEEAAEALIDAIEYPEEARALLSVLPSIRAIMVESFHRGFQDGRRTEAEIREIKNNADY